MDRGRCQSPSSEVARFVNPSQPVYINRRAIVLPERDASIGGCGGHLGESPLLGDIGDSFRPIAPFGLRKESHERSENLDSFSSSGMSSRVAAGQGNGLGSSSRPLELQFLDVVWSGRSVHC